MLIIKHGDKEKIYRHKDLLEFTCVGCDCQYVVDLNEGLTIELLDDPLTKKIYSTCPECNTINQKTLFR